MKKLFVFTFLALLVFATPAYAQEAGAQATFGNWSLAAIGMGLAAGLAALGQARVAGSAAEGMARNPAARPGIQLALILGLAFIESLVLFTWVLIFLNT